MLTLLLPDQVAANWDRVKSSLYSNLPPEIPVTEQVLTNIFEACLKEQVQVWVVSIPDIKNNTSSIRAIVLTTITNDFISGNKSLLVYSLYGYFNRNGDMETWADALESMKKYARSKNCSTLSFYSSSPAAISLAKNLGANIKNIFGFIEV